MSDKQEKEHKADKASKSSPLVLQLVASLAKEITFTKVGEEFLLNGSVKNFSSLWCLSQALPLAIQQLGLTRDTLEKILKTSGWPEAVSI